MNNNREEPAMGEVIPMRSDYPLLENPQAMSKILKMIDDNLRGQKISPLNLSRIKVPQGQDTEFKIETASGIDRRASIIGVITAFRTARAYWIKPYGTGRGNQPPDCTSKDGFVGVGKPGGDCTQCPLAAFGTARAADGSAGPGQACKELRQLLILLPGQMLPNLLAVPPTSLQNFQRYTLNLLSAGANYYGVNTKLTLEPAYSTGGIPYARIRFTIHSKLPGQQADILEPYHERMRDLLTPITVDTSTYEVIDEAPTGAAPQIESTQEEPGSPNEIPF